jgi:glucose uptake protein GlcU
VVTTTSGQRRLKAEATLLSASILGGLPNSLRQARQRRAINAIDMSNSLPLPGQA